jgi:hypothetical protein
MTSACIVVTRMPSEVTDVKIQFDGIVSTQMYLNENETNRPRVIDERGARVSLWIDIFFSAKF